MTQVVTQEGLSVVQWLTMEQLDCIIPKIEAYPVKLSTEDFAEFTEEDLRDLCKELGLQAGERVRLLKAVKKLPNSKCLQSTRVVHIFLGPEEQRIMEKLHTTYDQASSSIQILESRMQLLELSAKKCDVQIRMAFDQLAKFLFSHQQKLLQELEDIKKNKSTPIQNLIEKQKKDLTQLSKAKDNFKTIVSNVNFNSSMRAQKLKELQKNMPKYEQVVQIPVLPAPQINEEDRDKISENNGMIDEFEPSIQESKSNAEKSEKDEDEVEYEEKEADNIQPRGSEEKSEEPIKSERIENSSTQRLICVAFDKARMDECLKDHLQILATNSYRILTFGSRFPEDEIVLSQNNTTAMRRPDIKNGHSYVVVEDTPIFHGVHCWRIRTHNPMTGLGWVMWGISHANRRYKCYSCRDPSVWGMAPMNYYYGNKELMYDKAMKNEHFKQKDICIDMHLDLSLGELKFAIVDFDRIKYPEIVLKGVPHRSNGNGWIPHFNIHTSGLWVRVAKIPPRWYGRGIKRIPEFVE